MLRAIAFAFALALPLATALPAYAGAATPCAEATSTRALEQCAQQSLATADQALNSAYRDLLGHVSEPAANTKLVAAQRAWVAFRDADCAAQYQLYEGGSMRNLALLGCKQQRTEERTRTLRNYLPN
ncbi:lysozyme inhibitor LprI family protein [Pseudomonas typographi]|uniref:DUF1311 domain-containing protein n=1 Tax=Pseudomonas typographi TaxID=2715964 RepID=A0ABR7Z479_9PSED|nr:lysozyme inhibitor LprI family protein [Pseudomonas typographi]MBD1588256.1 DUF1311 domain-containing protein [Pseudomonas typographi]MBD1600227.1 DUF1311 domain-containing protein [Pseudomonas typographi]